VRFLSPSGAWRYVFAAVAVLLAVLLRVALRPYFEPGSYRLLILAVALATWRGGLAPGACAVVLAALSTGDVVPVPWNSAAPDRNDWMRFGMFLLESGIVMAVIASLRRARQRARAAERRREDEFRRHQQREREARAELEASEQRHRLLSEALPQIVWSADGDGRLQYGNRRWYDLTGLGDCASIEEWREVVHPDDWDGLMRSWRRSRDTGVDLACEYRLRRAADGAWRWHLGRAVAVRDVHGGIVRWLGTASDVDDLKRAQQVMLSQAALLEQRVAERTDALSERNEQLAAFAFTVSHDLRGPLRAMRGYSDALADDFGDALGPRGRDYLSRIGEATERMNLLIEALLAYGRLGHTDPAPEPVEVREALDRALAAVGDDFVERRVRLSVELPDDLPPVSARRSELEQVLQNLLVNAATFVAAGATPDVSVGAEARGPRVRVWVADRGIGIEPRHFERIFQPFERLHSGSAYPGAGIGLAIVHRAIQRMRGEVGVESAPGEGSRFWFELPAASGAGEPASLALAHPLEPIV
jgi:PAS domain S-box-containing protein